MIIFKERITEIIREKPNLQLCSYCGEYATPETKYFLHNWCSKISICGKCLPKVAEIYQKLLNDFPFLKK